MKQYFAEAPGKVILLGEHFVVHGGLALAATIGRSIRVSANPSDSDLIESSDLGVMAKSYKSAPGSLKPLFFVLNQLRKFVDSKQRLRVKIESQVPVGQGLGSSGSLAVAFTAVSAAALGHALPQETVAEFAMQAEKMVHRNPSGIDVYIPTFGGVSIFRRGELPKALRIVKPIQIIVAYTGQPRQTKIMIEKVTRWKEENPKLFDVFKAFVGKWVQQVAEMLEKDVLEPVGQIVSLNHGLLQTMGASNSTLDRLVNTCLAVGCYGAKLTGGGGGGAVLAIPPKNPEHILAQLKARGFQAEIHTVPMGGLKVWTTEQ